MRGYEEILNELKDTLIPSKTLEDLTQLLLIELKERLMTSNISMLCNGTLSRTLADYTKLSKEHSDLILALDFGGTKIKFGVIKMPCCDMLFQDEFDVIAGRVDFLFFDEIIKQICVKLHDSIMHDLNDRIIFVSTTFSFPLNAAGEILTMGKGFIMSDEVKGVNVRHIIKNSFRKILQLQNMGAFIVEIGPVINDSVAVYLSSKFMPDKQKISLILGTGFNTCFELPMALLPDYKRPSNIDHLYSSNALMNTEAGFLGQELVEWTIFDAKEGEVCDMPLEHMTAGKWLPLTLTKIIQYYSLSSDDIGSIDGRLLVDIIEGRFTPDIDETNLDLIREIGRLLLKRGALYLVGTLLAISRLIGQDAGAVLEVGYVGSFLAQSSYYQEQIRSISGGLVKLCFLENSNLIGAAIAWYLNPTTMEE